MKYATCVTFAERHTCQGQATLVCARQGSYDLLFRTFREIRSERKHLHFQGDKCNVVFVLRLNCSLEAQNMGNDQVLVSNSDNISSGILDVSFTNAVVLVTLSSFVCCSMCIVLFVYYKWRAFQHIVETRLGIVMFFLGVLLTTITTLSSCEEKAVYAVYRLTMLSGCGIVLLVVGCAVLFQSYPLILPLDDNHHRRLPVGYQHGSMGVIIWIITVPLSVLELLFAIGAAKQAPDSTYAAVICTALVQKIVQAGVYHFSLRHKVAKGGLCMACSWLLKIISFFNFAFWIDSIVTSNYDNEFVVNLFGKGFSIVKAAYNALVTDYRLLCCLVFLEHALELTEVHSNHFEERFDPEANEVLMEDSHISVNVEISQFSGFGYVLGIMLIATQVVAGLQYVQFVGNWANIFPIIASLVVIICGLLLLFGNVSIPVNDSDFTNHNNKWRETESKAIDVMVCFMGTIGFVFWFVRACYCGLWAYKVSNDHKLHDYLTWTTVKDFFYATTILFQLQFFVKMGPHYGCDSENSRQKAKHFYVVMVMMGLLSLLISFVVDEYNGHVESLLHKANLSKTMSAFLQAAAPIHLGFSLHMFLHFFIMNRRLSQFQYNWRQRQLGNQLGGNEPSTQTLDSSTETIAQPKDERRPLIH